MTLEKIREIWAQQPFRPFVIHLPDGRSLSVEHPEFVSFPEGQNILVVTHADGAESLIDLFLVSDITVKAPAPLREQ